MPRTFLVLVSLLGGLSVTACSSPSSSGGTQPTCGTAASDGGVCLGTTYVTCATNLTTPSVSFKNDILPILQPGCAIAGSTCHGAPTVVSQQRPYLGSFDGGTDPMAVLPGIVGVPSNEDPKMPVIAPGNPSNSFLMHKIDGDQCTLAADCASSTTQYTDCGQQMPYSSPPLDPATADIVRRWIAQGAKNN